MWLEAAYVYIKSGRSNIQQKIEDEFDRLSDLPYLGRQYNLIWDLENEMTEKDTDLLVNIVKFRGHFWT